ncbi:MAG: hypothetical protein AB7O97_02130 [Planctomycetota bacterium]
MGTRRTTAALAALLGTAAALAAQQPQWNIPALGAVEYRRSWKARAAAAPTADAARELPARGTVPGRYLPPLLPAPWLCHGELDADRRAVATPVRDLPDALRAIAFDLSVRGSCSWRFPRIVPFGDVLVRGRALPPDAEGWQTIDLEFERQRPRGLPGEAKAHRDDVERLCPFDLDGRGALRRQVDAAAGLVRSFRVEATLVVREDRREFRRIDLEDHWQLVAVRDNQDADFRARVADAVRRGSAWVREAITGLDAPWLQDREDKRTYGGGRIALAALTLLHAELPPDDPVVDAAFAALRRRRFVDTYSLATALMAMAQRYAPPREAELIRSGSTALRATRQLDERDRALAQKWLDRLLQNRDTRVDVDETLRFDYDGGRRYDNSLSQYGLLGLDAAALCGLEIPRATWHAAANHFVQVQCPPSGRAFDLELVTHRDLALAAGQPPRVVQSRAAPRGFSYMDPAEPPYGSLTAASTAGLVVARAGLSATGAPDRQLRAIDDAIDHGFAWLAAEFTARANPGFAGKADKHWYYWLYSLERVCELAGIAQLHRRDWYYEGAVQLLSQQNTDGSFPTGGGDTLQLESTCFAILFLKKSTLPAITGR